MDITYFEDGYYEGQYFVYTASASAGFTPYIAEGYLPADFFEDRGSRSSVVCDGIRLRIVSAEASLSSSFAQTTTANKDARTTVTLSTIANVSAQALKLRQLSSSLSAVATHTVQSTITARAAMALTSAFSPVFTAQASVSNGSNFQVTVTVTATVSVTKQFSNFINLGIRTGSPHLGISVTPTFGVNSRFNNFTMSIWVRRDTNTGLAQPIVSTRIEGSAVNHAAFVFVGTDIQTRFNADPDEAEAVWTNVAPTDGLWHHYLIRTVYREGADYGSGQGSAKHWLLWIDGVSQGQTGGTGYQAAGTMVWNDSYGGSANYNGVNLGHGTVANFTGGYDLTGRTLDGALAQLWMSYVTDAAFDPTDFYDGYIDFGTNGTRNGILTTPVIYIPLEPTLTDLGVGVTDIYSVPAWSGEYLKYTTTKAESTVTAQPEAVLLIVANIQAQSELAVTAARYRTVSKSLTSTATLQAQADNRTRSQTANLTTAVTVTAQAGAIKTLRIGQGTGVDATSEPAAQASPLLRFGTDNSATPVDNNYRATATTTNKFVMSMWMVNPIGYVFDADPNATVYLTDNPEWNANAIGVETSGGQPYFIYYGNTGYVSFFLGPGQRNEILNKYSHYLLSVDLTQSTNAGKYKLFKDGAQIAIYEVVSRGGVGSGTIYTVQTTPYNIPITAYGQYQLLANTSNYPNDAPNKLGRSPGGPNGGGYGDADGVKLARGGLTQFWWDYGADSYDIDNSAYRAKFYNGNYRDLGDQGTATGLSQPKHYVRLIDYQDIEEQGTQRSVQQSWAWKQQTLIESIPPLTYKWRLDSYTATTDQNSSNLLGGIRGVFTLTGESVTVLEITANLQSAATVNATATRIQTGLAALTSTATVNAVVAKFAGVNSQLTTTASITVISQRVRYADSALTSAVTLTSTAFRVKQFASSLSSLATQTAQADNRTRSQSATMTSQFAVTATIDNRNRDAIALQAGQFTLSIVYEVIRPAGSAMSAAFTVSATPEKRIISFGVFVVTATAVITAFKVVFAQANLTVQGFTLTQGDILNFDPCREIAVEEETRLARILPENRLIIVEQETRALRVPQETRVLKVDFETRVNITQC